MATTIFFNGRVTSVPGSYSEIDASGLATVGLGATGIVAVIGEAGGGAPLTPIRITNPGRVGRTFREGDLLEAGTFLFDPSVDPEIAGGAQEIVFVKVNPATQAVGTLLNANGPVLDITAQDWGVFTNQINIEVATGSTIGKAITVTDTSTGLAETFDNIGGGGAFSLLYTPGTDGALTMVASLSAAGELAANFEVLGTGLAAEYSGSKSGIVGLDSQKLADITAGSTVTVASDNIADTTQNVIVYGIDSVSGLAVSESLALNGTTPVAGVTTWAEVHGVWMDAIATGVVSLSDTGAAANLYQVPAGADSQGLYLFGAFQVVEVDDSVLTLVGSAGTVQNALLYGRDAAGTPTSEIVALNGTTPVASTTVWSEISVVTLGYVEAAVSLTLSGLIWNEGDTAAVVSNSAADTTQSVTIYGLDNAGSPQTEVLALNGVTPVVGAATWSEIYGAVLSAATAGTVVEVRGSTEDVVALRWNGAAVLTAGIRPVDNVAVSGTQVTVTDDSVSPRGMLLIGLDAANMPQVELVTPAGGTVTTANSWSEITGMALSHMEAPVTVTVAGEAFELTPGTHATVSAASSFLNALGGWSMIVAPGGGDLALLDLDPIAPVTAIGVAISAGGDLAAIIEAINAGSQLVSVEAASGANGVPDNTAAPLFLTGGSEGATTFANWQAALDLLREEFVNTIVPLTSDPAVHAAAAAHARFMAGPGRKERDVCLGTASGVDLATAKQRALELNTRHCRLAFQDVERFNVLGAREQYPPYFTAALAAGMQAGAEPATPLTFKFPNVLNVIGDDSYNLVDDANEIVQSGLLALEKVQGTGFRWLRNVTTHLIDNNIAFVEASTNQAVNLTAFNLRTVLEAAVGRKGFAGTTTAAASLAINVLNQMVDDTILTQWRNLSVTIELDVLEIDVEVAPVLPVNFVKTTIHLVTASFNAAT